jgi:hypothetical protein
MIERLAKASAERRHGGFLEWVILRPCQNPDAGDNVRLFLETPVFGLRKFRQTIQ